MTFEFRKWATRVILVFALAFSFLGEDLSAFEYRYHLLDELAGREIISFSSPQLIRTDTLGGVKLFRIKVEKTLKGPIKAPRVTLLCENIMTPEACNIDKAAPFLFVRKLGKKSRLFQKYKSTAKEIYVFDSRDGRALEPADEPYLRAFIEKRNNIEALMAATRGTKKPIFKASLFALMVGMEPENPSLSALLSDVLAGKTVSEKVAVLRKAAENAHKLEKNKLPLCHAVKADFKQTNPNIVSEAGLDLLTQLACSDNASFLLSGLKRSTNEFLTMLIPYHLGLTNDQEAVRQAVKYLQKNPKKLSLTVLDNLAFAIANVRDYELMEELFGEVAKQYSAMKGLMPAETTNNWFDNPDIDSIEQHYVRVKGHQPGVADQLISLLNGHQPKGWPFRSKDGKKSFRVQQQAITALEMQLAKGLITPLKENLRQTLENALMNGDPQIIPEIMHLMKRYYPDSQTDSLILRAATKPDAEKYHQSQAIMVFMESGQKDKAIQVAKTSSFKRIKKIGETLEKDLFPEKKSDKKRSSKSRVQRPTDPSERFR